MGLFNKKVVDIPPVDKPETAVEKISKCDNAKKVVRKKSGQGNMIRAMNDDELSVFLRNHLFCPYTDLEKDMISAETFSCTMKDMTCGECVKSYICGRKI